MGAGIALKATDSTSRVLGTKSIDTSSLKGLFNSFSNGVSFPFYSSACCSTSAVSKSSGDSITMFDVSV